MEAVWLRSSSNCFPTLNQIPVRLTENGYELHITLPMKTIILPMTFIYAVKKHDDRVVVHFVACSKQDAHPFWPVSVQQINSTRLSSWQFTSTQLDDLFHFLSLCAPRRSLRVLFVLNPRSGTKQARKIWEKYILPMLEIAGIEYTLQQTTHAGHAIDLLRQLPNPTVFTHIASIGGDGLFHEILNGILSRSDGFNLLANQWHLAVIAGGSSNALAKCLGVAHPLLATLAIMKPFTAGTNLIALSQENDAKCHFAHLSYCLGLISDIDLGSDAYRSLGVDLKILVSFLAKIKQLKSYQVSLSYLPIQQSDVPVNAVSSIQEKNENSQFQYAWRYKHQQDQFVHESEFTETIDLQVLNQPWLSADFLANPFANFNALPACLQVTRVRADALMGWPPSKWSALKRIVPLFLDQSKGHFIRAPFVERFQVAALCVRCTPLPNAQMNTDGEPLPFHETYLEPVPQAIRLCVPVHYQSSYWFQKWQGN